MHINFEKIISDACLSQVSKIIRIFHNIIESVSIIILIANYSTTKYPYFYAIKRVSSGPTRITLDLFQEVRYETMRIQILDQRENKASPRRSVFGLFLRQKQAHRYPPRHSLIWLYRGITFNKHYWSKSTFVRLKPWSAINTSDVVCIKYHQIFRLAKSSSATSIFCRPIHWSKNGIEEEKQEHSCHVPAVVNEQKRLYAGRNW